MKLQRMYLNIQMITNNYKKADARVGVLDEKIKKLDAELFQYRGQMSKCKPNTGPYNALKQKALRVLKQKKM
jgi:charged multivesicular body protein 5